MKINKVSLGTTALMVASSAAWGAGGVVTGPNVEAPDRYVYYPGTEELAEDEIRIIACGTGMPSAYGAGISLFSFRDGQRRQIHL